MTTCLYTRYNRLSIDNGLYRVNGALVISSNLPTILHRFRDTAFDNPKIATFGYPSCLTPLAEELPWDDLRKIFRGCQRMAKVPNAVEKLPNRLSRVHERYRRQTDGRQQFANVNVR